jgi:hypothetical protein
MLGWKPMIQAPSPEGRGLRLSSLPVPGVMQGWAAKRGAAGGGEEASARGACGRTLCAAPALALV